MKLSVSVLTAADTAVMLRVKLGAIRSWPDFLSDCIRGKQDIGGNRLLPCCRRRDRRGLRPHYALTDIEEFVGRVLASEPLAGRSSIKPVVVMIDTSLGWRGNKLDWNGAPMAYVQTHAVRGASHGERTQCEEAQQNRHGQGLRRLYRFAMDSLGLSGLLQFEPSCAVPALGVGSPTRPE